MDTSGSGRRRHRSWPETLKREIVAASFEPGTSVSLVARRYDLNTNQLFSWRKIYRDGLLAGPALVPVTVAAEPARDRNRPQGLAVRWLRPRRRARRFDVYADRDR